MLTTNQKGKLAEAKIAALCLDLGLGVTWPFDDERYDMILDLRPRLLRVQCKWAVRRGDVVAVRLYGARRGRAGLIHRKYDAAEIDAFAAYCRELDAYYLLPADEFVVYRSVHLRLSPSRNNQQQGIRWARDFEFAATLSRLQGPIAQLGERQHGMLEAAGSSPAGSIVLKPP
jgi:PD-(D/E)XK endonuclease